MAFVQKIELIVGISVTQLHKIINNFMPISTRLLWLRWYISQEYHGYTNLSFKLDYFVFFFY